MDIIEEKLEEYEAIISSLPDMVFVLTESGRYAAIVGGDTHELYHDASSLKNLNVKDVLPTEKANWFLERIQQTLAENKLQIFEYCLTADDVNTVNPETGPKGVLRFEGRVIPLSSKRYKERAVVWVARNITERYQLEKQLTYRSETDGLLSIYNRRKFFECLEDAFYTFQRYQENSSFLMLDVDNFKQINDNYGHPRGDTVMQAITKACKNELRHTDVIGRIGGDELGIIHKYIDKESSLALAKRLNKVINKIHITNHPANPGISISIGVSQFDQLDESVNEVFKRADIALYHSKRHGKNCYSTN